MSAVRQNFDARAEQQVNAQVNECLHASYTYLSLSCYFDRDDVALPNFVKFFKQLSDDKRAQADTLMRFENARGGRVQLATVRRPLKDEWGSPSEAMADALGFEKALNVKFIALHAVAADTVDPHMTDFVEEEFLGKEVECVKQLADHVTNLQRAGAGLGEYLFDRETLEQDEAK